MQRHWTRAKRAVKASRNLCAGPMGEPPDNRQLENGEEGTMAGTKNHDYHILPPDIAPLATTIGALTFTSGMVLFMHDMPGGHFVPWLGLAVLLASMRSEEHTSDLQSLMRISY